MTSDTLGEMRCLDLCLSHTCFCLSQTDAMYFKINSADIIRIVEMHKEMHRYDANNNQFIVEIFALFALLKLFKNR